MGRRRRSPKGRSWPDDEANGEADADVGDGVMKSSDDGLRPPGARRKTAQGPQSSAR